VARIEETGRAWGGHSLKRMPPASTPVPKGIGGWLLIDVTGRAGLLVHQLQLTVGAVVIYADPALAGLLTFVPLSALLLYEATNWLLVGLTVVAFVLIRKRRVAAISVNLALSGLWLAALVVWQFPGTEISGRDHHRRHPGALRSVVFPDLEEGKEHVHAEQRSIGALAHVVKAM
jgi:hypothetical protein